MAARRRAWETNPDRSPDPRVAEWLDRFRLAHEQTIGTKYLVRGARDGAHIKRALATHDEATIQRALVEYFADPSARRKYGASVPLFVDRIATLASARRPRLPVSLAPPAPATRGPSEPMRLGEIFARIGSGTERREN